MSRRRPSPRARPAVGAALAGLALGLALAPLPGCGGAEREPVRNVLLFVVDTLRADRLGCYGHPRGHTPNIDALAARGTLYENARPQGSNTRYSMLSLMSGLYVSQAAERLPTDYAVLAERVQDTGRVTAAFVGNKLLAVGSRGYARGFDRFEPPEPNPQTQESGNATEIVGQFTRWYTGARDEIRSSKGFFAWVHVMDPHVPYTAPKRYLGQLDGPLPDDRRLRDTWADPDAPPVLPPAAAGLADRDVARMLEENDLYDAEVARVDEVFGRLLDFLAEQGEAEDTLVIVASDHGELLYDRVKYPEEIHLWFRKAKPDRKTLKELFASGHGMSFHEELWRTPLILAGPGIPAGERRTELAANLDIYPTVLEAFGLEPPDYLPGRSLMGGVESAHERVFGHTMYVDAVTGRDGWKLVDRRVKMHEMYDPEDRPPDEGVGAIELFDLNADPHETENLAAQHPERVAQLSRLIREWRKQNQRAYDTADLTEADLQAMIELGYVEDAKHHGADVPEDG